MEHVDKSDGQAETLGDLIVILHYLLEFFASKELAKNRQM